MVVCLRSLSITSSTSLAADRVERGGRLVQDQQVGVVHLGLGDAQPLPLAARETFDRAVGFVGKPHQLECLGDALLDLRPWSS